MESKQGWRQYHELRAYTCRPFPRNKNEFIGIVRTRVNIPDKTKE